MGRYSPVNDGGVSCNLPKDLLSSIAFNAKVDEQTISISRRDLAINKYLLVYLLNHLFLQLLI